jgi:transposase
LWRYSWPGSGGTKRISKIHIIRHLGEALDQVRKSEYARLLGKNRRFIKGQKYTLLSRKENLTLQGRQALQTLLRVNERLNTILWSALELRARGLGTALLRAMARLAQMADAETLREVRRHDRSSLGWHRLLLQSGEQSLAGLRRRAQQQNPRLHHMADQVFSERPYSTRDAVTFGDDGVKTA